MGDPDVFTAGCYRSDNFTSLRAFFNACNAAPFRCTSSLAQSSAQRPCLNDAHSSVVL
jgi:hypothetical protein